MSRRFAFLRFAAGERAPGAKPTPQGSVEVVRWGGARRRLTPPRLHWTGWKVEGRDGNCHTPHSSREPFAVLNRHVSEARVTQIGLRGASLRSGTATTPTHSDRHPRNTFNERKVVTPQTRNIDIKGKSLICTIPPAPDYKILAYLNVDRPKVTAFPSHYIGYCMV